MNMKLESLTIALRHTYREVGPDNPYEAKLAVAYNENQMQIALSDDVCKRILALAGEEIAAAAQVQINEFVQTAIDTITQPAIEMEKGQ